jgi:hypothetical protein
MECECDQPVHAQIIKDLSLPSSLLRSNTVVDKLQITDNEFAEFYPLQSRHRSAVL